MICSRSDDRRKVENQKGEIQSETWPFCPIPHRNQIFGGSCGLARVAESRGGAECVSAALQDRWSLGELYGAEIPRKSATRLVKEEGGGEQDSCCSQNKPASEYKPKSSGKKCQQQDRAFSLQRRRPGSRGRRRWFRSLALAGCIGSGIFSLCVSRSLALCFFGSVNVRSRSLVSANDLTQQTESSGGAQPWTKKRRGGATSPPPGSRRASASLLCSLCLIPMAFSSGTRA